MQPSSSSARRPDQRDEPVRPDRGSEESAIRLTMPARAENVVVVRHVVAALAEAVGMPADLVDDIRLAVTEACTNVVRHAYAGAEGPLEVLVSSEADALNVVVLDHGRGIQPHPGGNGMGLGLPLIAALAADVQIDCVPDNGSRLRMCFKPGDTLQAA